MKVLIKEEKQAKCLLKNHMFILVLPKMLANQMVEEAQNYANVLSVVKTSVKRKINPKAIFNNEILFAKIKSYLT